MFVGLICTEKKLMNRKSLLVKLSPIKHFKENILLLGDDHVILGWEAGSFGLARIFIFEDLPIIKCIFKCNIIDNYFHCIYCIEEYRGKKFFCIFIYFLGSGGQIRNFTRPQYVLLLLPPLPL